MQLMHIIALLINNPIIELYIESSRLCESNEPNQLIGVETEASN